MIEFFYVFGCIVKFSSKFDEKGQSLEFSFT